MLSTLQGDVSVGSGVHHNPDVPECIGCRPPRSSIWA
jgi:hypothetical protein